tara:strand:- start:286 stop:1248 length:963 start_codon:yes stop_codon:yes gene_type:complete
MNSSGIFQTYNLKYHNSLYKNGKVFTKRDINGSDAGSKGIDLNKKNIKILDARETSQKNKISIDKQGFEILHSNINNLDLDFFNNKEVLDKYYSYCADFIKDRTGAKDVYAFDHNIRSASGKKSKKMILGGQQVQGPAYIVHGDYTLTSAPDRFSQLSKPVGKNDTLRQLLGKSGSLLSPDTVNETLRNGRFAIINLWRNIVQDPVEINPLALCDASTVSPQDLVVFEIHYADRIGENYFAKYNKNHKWYYYNKITKDEALLIKQWDSDGSFAKTNGKFSDSESINSPCTFSFHSAFKDPFTREDAPDRCSMEVRCIVIY